MNYRIEHARIRLSDHLKGLNPNAKIDTQELAWIDSDGTISRVYGLPNISEFYSADFRGFREEKWFSPTKGRSIIQGYIAALEGEKNKTRGIGLTNAAIDKRVQILNEVDVVLKIAQENDFQFHIAVSDR